MRVENIGSLRCKKPNANLMAGVPDGLSAEDAEMLVGSAVAV